MQEYLRQLRERKAELKRQLMIERFDNKFVESNDRRYVERRLISRILRLHKDG